MTPAGPHPRPRQLALALPHAESFAREDFLVGPSNALALRLIESWPQWPATVMALIGPPGSGKSHLASIWASATGARIIAAAVLGDVDPSEALATGALVLEHGGGEVNERALFHLLNLARQDGSSMLLTARDAPSSFGARLPDLASRLRAVPVVHVEPPDDALLRSLMVKLFADRQLVVDETLIAYLAARIERSFSTVRACVAALDAEALRRQRPITRSLAAEILENHDVVSDFE